jgi:hypothetical protein
MFIGPQEQVYVGMIIGEHSRDNDLEVNPLKGKKLTNVRASGTDEAVRLTPPVKMSLEEAIAYIDDDELVEVTPKIIRLRKRFLDPHERKRQSRAASPSGGGGAERSEKKEFSAGKGVTGQGPEAPPFRSCGTIPMQDPVEPDARSGRSRLPITGLGAPFIRQVALGVQSPSRRSPDRPVPGAVAWRISSTAPGARCGGHRVGRSGAARRARQRASSAYAA